MQAVTGLDVTTYRAAAGDATRSAQSIQRELASLDPQDAVQGIDHYRRIIRVFPPGPGQTRADYHRKQARRVQLIAIAHMLEARLADQEASGC